jgi:predicted RNA methylase
MPCILAAIEACDHEPDVFFSNPQKDMLEDHKRTGAYYQAVMQNRRQFEGKVVLDVGTGSGILAIFAARAGARKVYAVEATAMAKFARTLVQHNGVRPSISLLHHKGGHGGSLPPMGFLLEQGTLHS